MKNARKVFAMMIVLVLAFGVFNVASAQTTVDKVCLVTDEGKINDGTFNQYAYEGIQQAEQDFDLETSYIETQSKSDYDANIESCVQSGAQVIVTVGFLIADATIEAAANNPDVYFIGVDQFVIDGPKNFVGIQFREDQAGFLVGVLAALVANEEGFDTIAGVYGIAIPPVVKFRNGYEQGARYINPSINILGSYTDSFVDPAKGAELADQFISDGAKVVFGAGGPTGSGGILAAAEKGVYVIGVDQDEFFTSFKSGETVGSEFLITSAQKAVNVGVYDLIAILVEGDLASFPGGGLYVLDVANGGITISPKHLADLDDALYEAVEEVKQLLIEGTLTTGVDPVTGVLESELAPEATETSGG